VSARELLEASLDAIERLNGELNAFITLIGERALVEADAIGPGDARPLAGVPIAIKDILALTEGVRTTFGCSVVGDFIPPLDSNSVARLRGAGAIMVGKTNTPELGILPVTEPDRFGPTRNPWDPGRTPGGSSGGSAAAVSAGMVALAHANDGGGSIRIPAACCGLVGLKPTRGRISQAPLPDDAAGLVTEGVLTRTVADTAAALDLLAGPEPGDSHAARAPQTPFAEAATREPGRLRVAFSTEAPTGGAVHAACADGVRQVAELLESLGHEVVEAAPQGLGEALIGSFATLWTVSVASGARAMGMLAGRGVEPHDFEPLTAEMMAAADQVSALDYLDALGMVRIAGRAVGAFFADHDVLLTPTLAKPPLEIGALRPGDGEPAMKMFERAIEFVPFTAVYNATGQPAISLPLAETDAGLPVGVHFAGPAGGEELLLSLAAQLEAARPWADRRPAPAAA
jgi:amidase